MKTFLSLIAALGLLALPASAQLSSVTLVTPTYLTNNMTVATSTLTTLGTSTNYVTLWQNAGIAVAYTYTVGGTDTTSGGGMWIRFSVDGTNYGTPIIVAAVNTSKTAVTAQTNWSAAQLAGFTAMSIQLTNSSGSYVQTNMGCIVSRWNPIRPW